MPKPIKVQSSGITAIPITRIVKKFTKLGTIQLDGVKGELKQSTGPLRIKTMKRNELNFTQSFNGIKNELSKSPKKFERFT